MKADTDADKDDYPCSISLLPKSKKYALYESITLEDRTNYFKIR